MANEIEIDEKLWFYHEGCEGKHYLIGNPHTSPGRIFAWCPKQERSIFVSLSSMGRMSELSKYWINGYLYGNQPDPPIDDDGNVDFRSEKYRKWAESVELFTKTGYWSHAKRNCKNCGKELLQAEIGDACGNCSST